MLSVTIVERPRSTNLVTLSKLKTSLGIESASLDERLTALIEDVSSAVTRYCGVHFARTQVTEKLVGYGDTTLALARTPIARVDEVRFRDASVSADNYSVGDPDAGFLYRADGWTDTTPRAQWITSERVNMQGDHAWAVDYIGGYLMPGDTFIASGILSALAADGSFNLTGDTFPILVSGERMRVAGMGESVNNGIFTVLSRTQAKVVVTPAVVEEAASGVATITMLDNIMPADLQRIVIGEIRNRYYSERRDGDKTSERIGDWSAAWKAGAGADAVTGSTFGLSRSTVDALQRYVRVM